jgi:hypothetical protein
MIWSSGVMKLTEETEVLAESCPGACHFFQHEAHSNERTHLLSTADIPSDLSKPRLSSATAITDLHLCLVYKTDVWLLRLHPSSSTAVLLGGYVKV